MSIDSNDGKDLFGLQFFNPDDVISLTYTTRSGDVLTTLKPLRPEPSIILSETPDHPVHGVAVVGFSFTGKRAVLDIVRNEGCAMKWIVEDDENLIKEAKATLESIKIKDAKVVSSSQYSDVLGDKSVRIVIVSGPVADRPRRASEALKAHKDVLCDRPIAMNIDSARELFALGRRQKQVLMTLLPGRPGKSFSAVVMSLFSSASKIVCERVVPAGYQHPLLGKKINPSDASVEAMFIDTSLHDCFAVNFCMCMRPTEVSSSLVQGKEHKAEINLLYPNGCVYTIYTALGLESVDTQSFSLSGERLIEMRRVDHMHVLQHEISQEKHQESKILRFTQEYEAARADALEQMYAASSGAKAIASRVRPQLIEQNVVDCLRIAQACTKAFRTGQTVSMEYW